MVSSMPRAMWASLQVVSTGFSLAAVVCWGVSDFTGGYASKRSDAFLVTLLAHSSGFLLMGGLAVATHAPLPDRASQLWAMLAGALGGTALAIFYRTLAAGNMGLIAPVSAVLAAGIPTGFAMITEGVPGAITTTGFLLAGLGIWLVSRPEDGMGKPEGLWMAVIAGFGFAGFFIFIHRTGDTSAVWAAAHSRVGSLIVVGLIVLLRPGKHRVEWRDAALGLFAGCLDSTGTLFFIRAEQTGRLDAAVVISSLYPAITVLMARLFLREHFTRWKAAGIVAALVAVPLIALQ
jgi:drug/metabolite transporter (DMT)-like permease